ncbi:nodulation protein NfeD [bacterium SCSIO 12643]|nr:nodulation protein NfeD [bacterium SCSIO 12643]
MLLFSLFILNGLLSFASNDSSIVYVFDIKEEIAQPIWHNFQKAIDAAKENNADYLMIELDTYGGTVDMADSIRTAILHSPIPVYILIDNNAASAGALISIACDKIYMIPGSTIGAATVVTQEGVKAPDKIQSYFRSKMRATAEVKGRNPDIAEAMVDEDLEIEGITKKGKLLTFTVSEALTHGYCDKEVNNLQEVLVDNNLQNAQIIHHKLSSIDKIISFLIHPMISGFLIMIMIGGIYFELQSPGIGFPIAAAFIGALLFFAPLYIEGMAQNWEIVIFVIGIVALAVEILIIPGTGITGILGIIMIMTGLTLSMVKNIDFDFSMVELDGILLSFSVVLMATLFMAILSIILLPKMLSSGRLDKLVLRSSQEVEDGYSSVDQSLNKMVGISGITISDLRPSGKIEIESQHYDAFSVGTYIDKGEQIEVIGTEGPQLLVRKI